MTIGIGRSNACNEAHDDQFLDLVEKLYTVRLQNLCGEFAPHLFAGGRVNDPLEEVLAAEEADDREHEGDGDRAQEERASAVHPGVEDPAAEEQEGQARADLRRMGRSFLGRDRVLKASPYRRAASDESVRERNPTFAIAGGGRDALFEAVAELLWTGELAERGPWPHDDHIGAAVRPAIEALGPTATPSDRMMAGVVAAAAADPFRADRSAHGVATVSAVR